MCYNRGYEGLARLRSRVKASDLLRVYGSLTGHSCFSNGSRQSLSLSLFLSVYLSLQTLVPSICHFSFHFSILESLPAGLGQARTCLARPPAPAKVHNTLSRICRLPLHLSLIVYRSGLFFTDGGPRKIIVSAIITERSCKVVS